MGAFTSRCPASHCDARTPKEKRSGAPRVPGRVKQRPHEDHSGCVNCGSMFAPLTRDGDAVKPYRKAPKGQPYRCPCCR